MVVLGGSMTDGHECGQPYVFEEEARRDKAAAAALAQATGQERPEKDEKTGRKEVGSGERNGGCWKHCSPGHARYCAW